MDKIYTAKCKTIGFENYQPIGDLVVDYSLNQKEIKNYYIREYYVQNLQYIKYNDFKIDESTIVNITDYEKPLMVELDLATKLDLTYCDENYYQNE